MYQRREFIRTAETVLAIEIYRIAELRGFTSPVEQQEQQEALQSRPKSSCDAFSHLNLLGLAESVTFRVDAVEHRQAFQKRRTDRRIY